MSSNISHKGKKKIPLDTKCVRMIGTFDIYSDYKLRLDPVKNTYYSYEYKSENYIKVLCAQFETILVTNKWVMEYYFIPHTETDILHIHFALILKSQVQLSTMLNWIADGFNINGSQVSITRMDSLCGALKYFLHQDRESVDLGKKMYMDSEMHHNTSDWIYQNYLNSNNDDDISIPHLVYLALGCSCESEIYLHLESTKFCNKYKFLIHTIWNDRLELKKYLNDTELPF